MLSRISLTETDLVMPSVNLNILERDLKPWVNFNVKSTDKPKSYWRDHLDRSCLYPAK